jgi:hypothetical protein
LDRPPFPKLFQDRLKDITEFQANAREDEIFFDNFVVEPKTFCLARPKERYRDPCTVVKRRADTISKKIERDPYSFRDAVCLVLS